MRELYFSVSHLTRYIRDLFDSDLALQDVWLAGEASNCSRSSGGHLFFTLKDDGAQIRCAVWQSKVRWLEHIPSPGDALIVHGRVSVYEKSGSYELHVDAIQPAGVGILHLQFEALKQRLQAEGLFDMERKRPLPARPRHIGVVTSAQAAAFRDILNVLGRRWPLAQVTLAPTLVQGDEAPPLIVAALAALNTLDDLDVIIVARGGGALEDLWAFNDERVARAISASRVPVVSGVGHETDFTIADFVADLRAPTPSAAAELVTPDIRELIAAVSELGRRLTDYITDELADHNRDL